jgi:hypothetical protein
MSGTSRVEAVKRARDIKFMHNMQNKGGVSDQHSTIYHILHLFQCCGSAKSRIGYNAHPDPAFYLNSDPDPDPDPGQGLK